MYVVYLDEMILYCETFEEAYLAYINSIGYCQKAMIVDCETGEIMVDSYFSPDLLVK